MDLGEDALAKDSKGQKTERGLKERIKKKPIEIHWCYKKNIKKDNKARFIPRVITRC